MRPPSPHGTTRDAWRRFTGTAGWVVVTATEALLWTDGRYFLQVKPANWAEQGATLSSRGAPAPERVSTELA